MASETIITPRIAAKPPEPEWLAVVRTHVESLRYGIVQLVVHDGRVTQVERTEKVRLAAPDAKGPASHPAD
jgi:hypothetical protein